MNLAQTRRCSHCTYGAFWRDHVAETRRETTRQHNGTHGYVTVPLLRPEPGWSVPEETAEGLGCVFGACKVIDSVGGVRLVRRDDVAGAAMARAGAVPRNSELGPLLRAEWGC